MHIDVVEQADGTKQKRDMSFAQLLARLYDVTPLTSGAHGWIDELTASQLGLVMLLQAVKFRSVDLLALTQGKVEASAPLEIREVYLDFPSADATDPETPFAVVRVPDDSTPIQVNRMNGPDVDEDSVDVWGEDTALLCHGSMQHEFTIHVYFADKDDRAAGRKRLLEVFVTEPESDMSARRVVLPFYFDQPCTYQVVAYSQPDDGEQVQAGRWPLIMRVSAQVTHVTLVKAPPCLRQQLAGDPV